MISPAEMSRVIVDVVRRYPQLKLLEIPCERQSTHFIFPMYGASGGLSPSLLCVLMKGAWPTKPTKDFGADLNKFRLTAWTNDDKTAGRAASICWAVGLEGDALYQLFDQAAQALMQA